MEPTESAEGEVVSIPLDPLVVRRRFASHLTGEGIEIGPGHVPFPVPPTVSVRYVDRWEPSENSSLFPELGDTAGFPKPDVVANLDSDRLASIADASQNFVIASHVLEHLANPLAMLVDIHRVMFPGALLVLLIPDRHMTFDRFRAPTPVSHLIDEYYEDVREVDDAHVLDFLVGTRNTDREDGNVDQSTYEVTPEEISLHRRRSVHAHVWDADEFVQFMEYAADELGLWWEVVDTMPPGAEGTYGDEFGWVLRKVKSDTDSLRRRDIWPKSRRGH